MLAGMLFWLAYRADISAKQSAKVLRVDSGLSLVGTWIGEVDNIMDLRSDGTVRWADRGESIDKVRYSEWSVEQNTLEIIYAPRKKRWFQIAASTVLGTGYTKDSFTISWIDADTVELTNSMESKTLILRRCTDATVQRAP